MRAPLTDEGAISLLNTLALMQVNVEVVTGLGALLALACKAPGDVSPDSLFAVGECVTDYGEKIERQRHRLADEIKRMRGGA